MSKRWFRLYDEVLDDPKVQKLPPDIFKFWINILCVASKNNGVLPPIESLSFVTRCNEKDVTEALDCLIAADLISVSKNQHSSYLTPHNWKKRQYKSDTSTERVKRYRDNKKTVTCNVTVTPPDADANTDSDTDTDFARKGFKNDVFVCAGFQGTVIQLDGQNFGEWFKRFSRDGNEAKFRKLIKHRDDWYAKQPYSVHKNWMIDTTKWLLKTTMEAA